MTIQAQQAAPRIVKMSNSTMRSAVCEAAFNYADKLQRLAGVLRRAVGEPDPMAFSTALLRHYLVNPTRAAPEKADLTH